MLLLFVGVLGLGWDQRARLRAWLAPLPAALEQKVGGADAGPLRKCVRGQEVTYTDAECPAGHQPQALTGAPVTVLPATPVPKRAEAGSPGSSAPALLRKALDVEVDANLKDRRMERAIDGTR